MNEQDLILKQKIEKREKTDIMLAYILIIILVGCIGIVLYLKFIRKEEVNVPEEYVPNYISLSTISSSLNSSILANRYLNDGATFTSNVSGNSLVVTYTKEDNIVNLNIPVVSNELVINITDDNEEVITDIYKEIATITCMYYDGAESDCRYTLDNISADSSISGIRFDNNNVYIDMTKRIDLSTVQYNVVTKTDVSNTNYILNLLDNKISNIMVNMFENSISVTGTIERLTDDRSDFSVVVKLYDIDSNVLEEKKYEFNESNLLDVTGTFTLMFEYNDTLKEENIDSYSIEIVK